MVLKKQEKHHNFQRDNIFKLYKFIKILQPNTIVGFVLFLSFIKSIKILIFFRLTNKLFYKKVRNLHYYLLHSKVFYYILLLFRLEPKILVTVLLKKLAYNISIYYNIYYI